jgi:hypothetical protein
VPRLPVSEPPSLSRYDLLLAVIAAPLVVATLLAAALPVSFRLALAAACLPAGGGLGYALFYRPPALGSS